MSIGENIKRIRKEKGITQKALAEKMHVDPSMISQWETTREPAKLETIEKIAAALRVNPYELYPASTYDELEDAALNEISKHFHKLNEDGKKEAVKRVYELTLINKYTKPFWEVTEDGRIKIKD